MRLQILKQRRHPQAVGLAFSRGTSRSAALLVPPPRRPLQATLNRAPGFSSSTSAAFVPTRLLASAAGHLRPPAILPMLNDHDAGGPFKPAAQRDRLVLTCCSRPNGCRCSSTGRALPPIPDLEDTAHPLLSCAGGQDDGIVGPTANDAAASDAAKADVTSNTSSDAAAADTKHADLSDRG